MVIISDAIKKGRRKCGYSQNELAEKFGVNQSQVSKWENGSSIPTGDDLIRLAEILQIVDVFFPGYVHEKQDDYYYSIDKRLSRLEKHFGILA